MDLEHVMVLRCHLMSGKMMDSWDLKVSLLNHKPQPLPVTTLPVTGQLSFTTHHLVSWVLRDSSSLRLLLVVIRVPLPQQVLSYLLINLDNQPLLKVTAIMIPR